MSNEDTTATVEVPVAAPQANPAPEATPAPQANTNPAPETTPAPQAPAAPAAEPALPPIPAAPPVDQPTPEQLARQRAQHAQAAIDGLVKEREDAAAAEIQKICAKYGVDLIVGHSVKVQFNRNGKMPV